MTDIPEQKIDDAVELWKGFWGDSLQAVYLYGSAARGEWSAKSSDVNLLLLLTPGDHYERWLEAAGIVRKKARKGFAPPLILTSDYIKSSLDAYPIEFLGMKLFHRTLFGEDIFDSFEINPADLRLQAEREIKGKWVQLRQAALERGGNTAEMRELLAMTVPTWVSVFQALLVLDGREVPREKSTVLQEGATLAGLDSSVFIDLEKMRREKKSLNKTDAWNLLLKTLKQLDILAQYIDAYQ